MNQRVLVLGASGGIGAACVRRLAADGHAVLGVNRHPAQDGSSDAAHSDESKSWSTAYVDITEPGGADHAVERAVEQLGGLSGVVYAIGMSGRKFGDGPITECTDEGWSEVIRVNLESAFRLLRAALRVIDRGGSVVVVGSVLAHHTDPDFVTAAYAASKAGLDGLVRISAREAATREIRVNCVAAGLVDTPMASRALSNPAITNRLPELQPLGGRALTPDEVASVVAWLLSDDAAAVTGCCIPADRGWSLR